MSSFSHTRRHDMMEALQTQVFDVLIVGGGITGAGIALDAATRGLKVALVEQHDFAFGTSSRSTKLIHGGLRYLKQLEFGLVKEVGSERAVVHKLAPHLVIPEKMLLPLYEKRGLGSLLTSFGLKLYDWLAGVKPEDQRRMLTRSQTLKQEPLLNDDGIKGGAIYAEYRTDDARLTIEIIKTAVARGAVAMSYCRVTDFVYEQGKAKGARVKDEITQSTMEVKAACVVNATGPWVDALREKDRSKTGKTLHLTKGVHVVVAHEKLPIRQAIYFDVEEDGRMIFAIPRGNTTYIGTTDTTYKNNLEEVTANAADVTYLINAVNKTFRSVNLSVGDVQSSWAGLRPLIHEEGKSESELSRKDEIFESPSGLISIAGGKLTGYRKMAERIVDLVVHHYFKEKKVSVCATANVPIVTPSFADYAAVKNYIAALSLQLRPYGLEGEAHYLTATYGKQASAVMDNLEAQTQHDAATALVMAELQFCFDHEMMLTPADFVVRRTGMLFFDLPRLKKVVKTVLLEFKKRMAWTDQQMIAQEEAMQRMINTCHEF